MRWSVEAKLRTVAGFKGPFDVRGLPLAAADKGQASHHRTHLVMEEAACRRCDVNLLADLRDIEPVERLHRTLGLALSRAESREVMTSNELRGPLAHRLQVERDGDVPDPASVERRRRSTI